MGVSPRCAQAARGLLPAPFAPPPPQPVALYQLPATVAVAVAVGPCTAQQHCVTDAHLNFESCTRPFVRVVCCDVCAAMLVVTLPLPPQPTHRHMLC